MFANQSSARVDGRWVEIFGDLWMDDADVTQTRPHGPQKMTLKTNGVMTAISVKLLPAFC